ncbi:MAG: hypothetical protein NVS1B1_09030 [Candidatus Limnocylindrales bacterium]
MGTRAYTVTPGVLERGMLSDEFGVDLDSITWVTADREHVAESQAHLPSNVSFSGEGVDLFPRLESGALDAASPAWIATDGTRHTFVRSSRMHWH